MCYEDLLYLQKVPYHYKHNQNWIRCSFLPKCLRFGSKFLHLFLHRIFILFKSITNFIIDKKMFYENIYRKKRFLHVRKKILFGILLYKLLISYPPKPFKCRLLINLVLIKPTLGIDVRFTSGLISPYC